MRSLAHLDAVLLALSYPCGPVRDEPCHEAPHPFLHLNPPFHALELHLPKAEANPTLADDPHGEGGSFRAPRDGLPRVGVGALVGVMVRQGEGERGSEEGEGEEKGEEERGGAGEG